MEFFYDLIVGSQVPPACHADVPWFQPHVGITNESKWQSLKPVTQ